MELDISCLVIFGEFAELSGSIAELGPDAGKITWANSMTEADRTPLLRTEAELDAAREWAGEFGAWEDAEIAAWSAQEINAFVIQYIAGNLREIEALCSDKRGEIDWKVVERMEQEGRISGNIYRADNGRYYFYLGS
jgi:hypothetical protein